MKLRLKLKNGDAHDYESVEGVLIIANGNIVIDDGIMPVMLKMDEVSELTIKMP